MIWKREICPQDLQQREVGKDENTFWFQVSPGTPAPVRIQGQFSKHFPTISALAKILWRGRSTARGTMSLTTVNGFWSTNASVAQSSTGTSSQGWRWSLIRWEHKIRWKPENYDDHEFAPGQILLKKSRTASGKAETANDIWGSFYFPSTNYHIYLFQLWIQNLTFERRHRSFFLSQCSDMHVKFQSWDVYRDSVYSQVKTETKIAPIVCFHVAQRP